MNELIEKIKQWGIDKGITGPNGKGTLLGQLSKTQEELTETRDAAVIWLKLEMINNETNNYFSGIKANVNGNLKDGIGDTTVTLILAAEMAGLDFQDCLQAAYDVISKRTGKMENGVFVKDN
jgi:NTP pyrophosphatase (non-canonical NTP hydrolase)